MKKRIDITIIESKQIVTIVSPSTSIRVFASENLEVISPVFLVSKKDIGNLIMYPQYFKTIDLESGLLSFNGYRKSDEKN